MVHNKVHICLIFTFLAPLHSLAFTCLAFFLAIKNKGTIKKKINKIIIMKELVNNKVT